MHDIVVVGSINADQVVVAKKRPVAGETLIGESYSLIPGGKGANQAVAAARLGKSVAMVGCVGNDDNGKFLMNKLKDDNIFAKNVELVPHTSTGIANIVVAEGDNSIIIIPGANYEVTIDFVKKHIDTIMSAKLVVLQLEIPLETVEFIIDECNKAGVPTLLNPAPAKKLNENIIEKVTFITPNEHECKIVFGTDTVESALRSYPNKAIVTEGEKGVRYFDGNNIVRVDAFKTNVVDTTGAGDTFNGAFATGIIDGKSLEDAVRFANKAASISVTKFGAQAGMPSLEEVKKVVD